MGRSRKVKVVDKRPQWQVLNGSISLLDKRTFKAGDFFNAEEHEISDSFRDIIVRITPVEEKKIVKKNPKYFLREVVADVEEQDKDGYVQLYEVIDSKDKVISEKNLPRKEATDHLKSMNA